MVNAVLFIVSISSEALQVFFHLAVIMLEVGLFWFFINTDILYFEALKLSQ